jgi:hypothetical protein
MNKIIQVLKLTAITIIFGLMCIENTQGQSCIGSPEIYANLGSDFKNFKVYPSLAPRSYLKIGYGNFLSAGGPVTFSFNSSSLSDYIIVKNGASPTKENLLRIDRIETLGKIKYFVFDAKSNGLKKGEAINVGLCITRTVSGLAPTKVLLWDSNAPATRTRKQIDIPEIELLTLKATPNVVPDQELIDETKKTVGQLKFSVDVPSIIRNDRVARFYFNTDNNISTDWKDKDSKLEMKFGAERSVTKNWYVPINFETKVNGDQRLKNATFVASSGIKTIIPWAWTKKGLFNSLIRAPVSPEFGISAEYYRRLKQDAKSLAKFPKKDSFALASEFKWNPIQLFTRSCEGKDAAGNVVEKFDECFSAQNISLELSAKGWWFPYEKTTAGEKVRRFEGKGEISLLIPIRSSLVDQFLFNKKDNATPINATQRIRIKYTMGANDAAGFKRSSQLTFGYEIIP